ncbi:MAG: hypothetical protein JW757_13905 [Anaerolineales bacterium]|nr:hypothetical protein [Anaerolineales bacterium]
MFEELRSRLEIGTHQLAAINSILLNPDSKVVSDLIEVVSRYGTPEEINAKAEEAGKLENLLAKVKQDTPNYYQDLLWLIEQRDKNAFISVEEYRKKVLGEKADKMHFKDEYAVTLEISSLQYFPWLIEIAKDAIASQTLMPGRYIRVRNMKEQEIDGDLPAVIAAVKILGASWVETMDTKGTDGSNIHLGGPDTITGYFGGVGQPNDHALKWVDEFLYYYTNYGVRQVLNINPGTVLLGYMMHKLGINNEFKISVYMGNDNPYAAFWTLIGAKLFAREDGTSPLIGFNWSNSVNNQTMEITAQFRKDLGFEDVVRYEHHITETYRHIVIQPYNRRNELVELADHIANISAKHEGGDPEIEAEKPIETTTSILDYFRDKQEVIDSGDWDRLLENFKDKQNAINETARVLTENGLSFVAASVHKSYN